LLTKNTNPRVSVLLAYTWHKSTSNINNNTEQIEQEIEMVNKKYHPEGSPTLFPVVHSLEKMGKEFGKFGKIWENLGKFGKIGKNGKKWEKMGKNEKNWKKLEKLEKNGKNWEKLEKL
jgi:hypothetical protein